MRKILTACLWHVVVACPLASLRADDPAEALPLVTVSANRFGPAFELVTLDDGKGEQALTDSPGFNALAAYSPDQRYIAYVHFDRPIGEAVEGGTLMLYDLETLTHTPIAPQGMRCGRSKLVWKPQPGAAGH